MKDKIKKLLTRVFLTHIGRIFFLSIPLLIIGGIMSPYGTIGEHIDYKNDITVFDGMMYVGLLIFAVEIGLFFYWAIKNLILDIKKLFTRKN